MPVADTQVYTMFIFHVAGSMGLESVNKNISPPSPSPPKVIAKLGEAAQYWIDWHTVHNYTCYIFVTINQLSLTACKQIFEYRIYCSKQTLTLHPPPPPPQILNM